MASGATVNDASYQQIDWVFFYTTIISILGGLVIVLALLNLPQNKLNLAVFALMVVIAELGSVELFRTSRNSSVSTSMIIAIAAILAIGPFAGVLIEVMNGITATFMNNVLRSGKKNRASWFRRSAFNIGMFVLSTGAAGEIYSLTGGRSGDLLHFSNIIPLILAITTQIFVNLALLITVIHLQTRVSPWEIWKQDFQWTVPINIAGGIIGGSAIAMANQTAGLLGTAVFFVPIFTIGYSFRLYVNNMRGYVSRLEQANEDLKENNIELLETLGAVIDAYDTYTLKHSAMVAEYAGALAQQMGLPVEEQRKIIKAALVHDIGKIGVPDNIIGKNGALTEEEFEHIRRHPSIGADILRRTKGFQDLVPLVLSHQEKYDGTGYPEGLKGDAIPLGARIITLADSVEAMSSDRAYRPGYEYTKVIQEVTRCSGAHFDPRVVRAFLAVIEEKGPGFLKNSAQLVDEEISLSNGALNPSSAVRFLKRSLVK